MNAHEDPNALMGEITLRIFSVISCMPLRIACLDELRAGGKVECKVVPRPFGQPPLELIYFPRTSEGAVMQTDGKSTEVEWTFAASLDSVFSRWLNVQMTKSPSRQNYPERSPR